MRCKKLLLAFIMLIFITALFPVVTSQYLDHFCFDNGNYSSESLYRFNLKGLLTSLSSNIGNNGFYSASAGEANAVALCRADIQLNECRGCIGTVADEILRLCPNQLQAIRWTQFCMLRFTNETVFRSLANFTGIDRSNALNSTSPEKFKEVRGTLMEDLLVQAANGGSLRKAAAGNSSASDSVTIFALLQCTPDLSPENCSNCLVQVAQRLSAYDAALGVSVYSPFCILRYEIYPFYNITRLQEPLTPPPPPGKSDDHNTTRNIIIIIISAVVSLSLALCVGIFVRKRIKQKTRENAHIGEDADEISTVESIQYDFEKIRAATNDFSDANKLGQGGFGAVYKGKLQNGREIAVKRLSKGSSQGDLEFKNEVLLMARLQHRNLVRLLGFSIQGIERLLVYEFVKNGSLDHVIFDPIKSSDLDWDRRYKITGGVARGLLYLHEDSRLRIIHRDLKASNVLLDEEMNPKISDFGMAKLVMPDATQESTSRVVGTYGYMAPEYAIHGQISVKSDIFTFGVLVLQIVSGQKKIFFLNGENIENHLLSHAWRSWREGTSANMIDPVLMSTSGDSKQDMLRCIHIALLCVQKNPDDRPTMASVVLMLNSLSLTLPLPSEPGFYMPSSFSEASPSQEYNSNEIRSSRSVLAQPAYSLSGNDSSVTNLYPR